MVDAMGAGDDTALRGLPEHFGEAHHQHGVGRDDVGLQLRPVIYVRVAFFLSFRAYIPT